jgi:hypothetical protein
VRPGITGLAQVSGRNALTWEEKFTLDVRYVDRRSIALDLSILLRTVTAVARRAGVSAPGVVTMPEFIGSAEPSLAPQRRIDARSDDKRGPVGELDEDRVDGHRVANC